MRGLKINEQSKKPKIGINPINGKVKISGQELSSFKKNVSRDIPLAPTPEPISVMRGKSLKAPNGGYSTGVQVSPKDEKAHPEDFKYLKKK